MRALRRGDRGREVEDLQTRLLALGYDLGNRGMDRVFGPLTELAVKAFQQEMGTLADGVVGELTWNEIVEAITGPVGASSTYASPRSGALTLRSSSATPASLPMAPSTMGSSRF